jgi:hypothetical protein
MEFEELEKTILKYKSSGNFFVLSLKYHEDLSKAESIIATLLKSRFINWGQSLEMKIHGPFNSGSLSVADFDTSTFQDLLKHVIDFVQVVMFDDENGEDEERFMEAVSNLLFDIYNNTNEYFEFKYEYDGSTFEESQLENTNLLMAEWYPFSFFKSCIIVNKALKMVYVIEIADD